MSDEKTPTPTKSPAVTFDVLEKVVDELLQLVRKLHEGIAALVARLDLVAQEFRTGVEYQRGALCAINGQLFRALSATKERPGTNADWQHCTTVRVTLAADTDGQPVARHSQHGRPHRPADRRLDSVGGSEAAMASG